MIIIPLEKSIDWRRPPIITFLLILINSLILVYSHRHDTAVIEQMSSFYVKSELPKIELPRFLATKPELDSRLHPEELTADLAIGSADDDKVMYVMMMMERDQAFMAKLKHNEIVKPKEPMFAEWQTARSQFEAIENSSIAARYGFTPVKHQPITFISHQFLHGGYDHLFGNMLFLLLIGMTLEAALGSLLYLFCYVLSGLGAVTLYWLMFANSSITLVGASGSIAGLMGMYAGVFGLRKIRFFYSLVFYFDYIRAPALVMLPLWLGNEIYQHFFTQGSNVAYMAHVGGLLTGGLISFAIKRFFTEQVDTAYLDESAKQEEKSRLYEQGLKFLRELKVAQAKAVFASLHSRYSDDRDILMQYYNTLKVSPETHEYQVIFKEIIDVSSEYEPSVVSAAYQHYLKFHKLSELPTKLAIKLALFFSKHNNPTEAEAILFNLLKTSKDIEGLGDALFTVGSAWHRLGNADKHKMYLSLLLKYYPTQSAGINARKQLEWLALPK